MPNKRYKAEQIVTLLRQIEVGIANGRPIRDSHCRIKRLQRIAGWYASGPK